MLAIKQLRIRMSLRLHLPKNIYVSSEIISYFIMFYIRKGAANYLKVLRHPLIFSKFLSCQLLLIYGNQLILLLLIQVQEK